MAATLSTLTLHTLEATKGNTSFMWVFATRGDYVLVNTRTTFAGRAPTHKQERMPVAAARTKYSQMREFYGATNNPATDEAARSQQAEIDAMGAECLG